MILSPIASLLALAAAAAAFVIAGRTRGLAGRSLAQRFLDLGGAALVAGLIARLVVRMTGSPAVLLALAGLALVASLWVAVALIASLCLPRTGKVGWVLIAVGTSLAVPIALFTDQPLSSIAVCLLPITFRTPWLDRDTTIPARLLLLAAGVVVWHQSVAIAGILPDLPPVEQGLVRLGIGCLLSYAAILTLKNLLRLPGKLFDRLRLRARLVISYTLVAGIPVLLGSGFLVILGLFMMGAYRSELVARLVAPGPGLDSLAAAVIADPGFVDALQAPAPERHRRFDAIVSRHLEVGVGRDAGLAPGRRHPEVAAARSPGGGDRAPARPGFFLIGGVRDHADTTRMTVSAAPLGAAPGGALELVDLMPPCPFDGFMLVDSLVYATHGMLETGRGHDRLVQVCRRFEGSMLDVAARLAESEILCVFTDSLEYEYTGPNLQIDVGQNPNLIVFSSSGATGLPEKGTQRAPAGGDEAGATLRRMTTARSALGLQALPAFRISDRDTLSTAGGVLIAHASWRTLFGTITDRAHNPFVLVIWAALGVIGVLFLAVELTALVTGGVIAHNITRAVTRLTRGTRRLAADDLDHRLEIERGDELGELGRAFNAMAAGLRERRRLLVEQERLASELQVAHDIQQRMLPAGVPDVPGLDLAGVSLPSREVGGDAYDFLAWGDGRLAVTVADVAGKGVPAALLMSNLQATVRAHARRPAALARVMEELNRLIVESTEPGRFITFFLGVIEPEKGLLRYVNAGHNPPFLVRADGPIDRPGDGGLLLGTLPESRYREGRTLLRVGDVLVLFTDGVVEAQRGENDYFEDERLERILASSLRAAPAEAIRDRVVAAVQEFAGDTEQSDDVTVVVVKYLGREALPRPDAPGDRPPAAGGGDGG